MKVSALIPCFNEEKTIELVVNKILISEHFKDNNEVIIVDDSSLDESRKIIERLCKENPQVKGYYHNHNQGKGASLKTGLKHCSGDIIIIQDADLEYDPKDYNKLILPFLETDADVVYGSRFLGGDYVRLHFFWHFLANKILTLLTNIMTNLNMTDMETGYKVFKKNVISQIDIEEKTFGVEPEITIKLAKKNFVFYEVPISYKGRSYKEGKKITLKDAFIAVYCIFKYKFFR